MVKNYNPNIVKNESYGCSSKHLWFNYSTITVQLILLFSLPRVHYISISPIELQMYMLKLGTVEKFESFVNKSLI